MSVCVRLSHLRQLSALTNSACVQLVRDVIDSPYLNRAPARLIEKARTDQERYSRIQPVLEITQRQSRAARLAGATDRRDGSDGPLFNEASVR